MVEFSKLVGFQRTGCPSLKGDQKEFTVSASQAFCAEATLEVENHPTTEQEHRSGTQV